MRNSMIRVLALVVVVAGSTGLATAQSRNDTTKSAEALKSVFTPIAAAAAESTVQVKYNSRTVALGTIVDSRGYIMTKASELATSTQAHAGGDISVKLRDDKEILARIVGTREDLDLVCLKIDAANLKAVTWSTKRTLDVGEWVAAPGMPGKPILNVGIVSTPLRKIAGTPAMLGVKLDDTDDGVGVRVSDVTKSSPAERAGLKPNDLILKVNGKDATSRADLRSLLQGYEPGTVVVVVLDRDGEELTLKATLASQADVLDAENPQRYAEKVLAGELSKRKANFPTVIQHDTVLRPSDCGGPLVDLDGNVLGINIARAGRTESYAIPADLIKPMLAQLIAAAASQPATKQVSVPTKHDQ